jgi:hypothetical protein
MVRRLGHGIMSFALSLDPVPDNERPQSPSLAVLDSMGKKKVRKFGDSLCPHP